MPYFPFFMDISGKRCVVAGGGSVALRKIEKLLPFGADITVIAPDICEEIAALPVQRIYRKITDTDLDGAALLIAATDDKALHRRLFAECTRRHILCNAVDDKENCGFLFPALVQTGDLTVGISTGGGSPAFAKFLRRQIEALLDERMLQTAQIMRDYRPEMLRRFEAEDMRRRAAEALLSLCQQGDSVPEEAEILALWEAMQDAD